MEGINKKYGTTILVSDPIPEMTGDAFVFRKVEEVAVKGKVEGTAIYELVGPSAEVFAETQRFMEANEAAWPDYKAGEFDQARGQLGPLAERHPDDLSVARILETCERFSLAPPAPSWNGVMRLQTK